MRIKRYAEANVLSCRWKFQGWTIVRPYCCESVVKHNYCSFDPSGIPTNEIKTCVNMLYCHVGDGRCLPACITRLQCFAVELKSNDWISKYAVEIVKFQKYTMELISRFVQSVSVRCLQVFALKVSIIYKKEHSFEIAFTSSPNSSQFTWCI